MPIAGVIDFKIGGTTMTYQPSGIEEIFPEPIVHNTLGSARIVSEPLQPAQVVVTWGVEAARKEAIQELRTKRANIGLRTISYADITGATQTRTVYIPQIPYSQFLLANAVDQVSITMVTLI